MIDKYSIMGIMILVGFIIVQVSLALYISEIIEINDRLNILELQKEKSIYG